MAKRNGVQRNGRPQTFNQFVSGIKNDQSTITAPSSEETRPLAGLQGWIDGDGGVLRKLKEATNLSATNIYNAVSGATPISPYKEKLILDAAEKLGFERRDLDMA
ncbi:MAG: hypothetical protein IT559_01275 [Alphaproteobacteria bacterium]|nr:hypothetical protein [Alphaproteobacteria bacterium]